MVGFSQCGKIGQFKHFLAIVLNKNSPINKNLIHFQQELRNLKYLKSYGSEVNQCCILPDQIAFTPDNFWAILKRVVGTFCSNRMVTLLGLLMLRNG